MLKNNPLSDKRQQQYLTSQGTQTDPEITQQAFTQAALSENLFLLLQRQREDSNLLRNLFLNNNNNTKDRKVCETIGCEKIARNNKLNFCASHWNETKPCKISNCQRKRNGLKDHCPIHFKQLRSFQRANKSLNFCNVENCINLQRRRGVCNNHL
jgi:hypothetical protein